MVTTARNLSVRYLEAPAAAKNMLVGKGKGMAAEAARVPEPHFSNIFRSPDTLLSPNLLFK